VGDSHSQSSAAAVLPGEGSPPSGRAGGSRPRTILLVDDDSVDRALVRKPLGSRGHRVVEAATCGEAERRFAAARPDIAVLDYRLPDGDALTLLERLRRADPDLPVVILTAHGSIELAVEAMRRGAEHFLTKPPDPAALAAVVERCLARRRDRRRQRADDSRHVRAGRPDPFQGTSAPMRRLEIRARRVAVADTPVLLLGETGCGKGLLARWLHDHSPRAGEPFVDLNCAGLKPELLENELFGHGKGAFTGAESAAQGLLEVADRGTLFLDEIADMDLAIQGRLLKVLEEQTFRRLGEVRERRVDVRLIAATHRQLERRVRRELFRRDLYFRINTLALEIPPLRRRWEDIPILAERFLDHFGRKLGRSVLELSPGAVAALVGHRWPGNIRELKNVVERAVLLGEGPILEADDLHFDPGSGDLATDTLSFSLEELEKRHIERVLSREGGSVSRAIRILDIPRSSLYKKIKKYGIDLDRR
jgi:DNA-binding NtrC family response regulator